MLISIVIPAYNASGHIGKALESISLGFNAASGWGMEVIVVDDGSRDPEALSMVCARFKDIRLLRHERNRGMCAARNTGIRASKGDYVTLLDADDQFIAGWFSTFCAIVDEWPDTANVCFTPCVNDNGDLTCVTKGYKGWLTAESMVLEHLAGEYNPIFRGDYIRRHGYRDLGTRKSCGLLTYLGMAQEAPFWVTDKVMRHYNENVEQSVTHGWTRPDKAAETYICFTSVLAEYGEFVRGVSKRKYYQLQYKRIIYRMLARQDRDFSQWWRSRSLDWSWLATLGLLLLGPKAAGAILAFAKRFKLVRRYG